MSRLSPEQHQDSCPSCPKSGALPAAAPGPMCPSWEVQARCSPCKHAPCETYVPSSAGRDPTISQFALLEGPTTATKAPLLSGHLPAQQDVCIASWKNIFLISSRDTYQTQVSCGQDLVWGPEWDPFAYHQFKTSTIKLYGFLTLSFSFADGDCLKLLQALDSDSLNYTVTSMLQEKCWVRRHRSFKIKTSSKCFMVQIQIWNHSVKADRLTPGIRLSQSA